VAARKRRPDGAVGDDRRHQDRDVNLTPIPTDWSVQGTGDFNGDSRSGDILWRRASDGQTVLWEMNGGSKIADLNLNAIPTEWSVQGIGDFNGDGKSDILWRRAGDGQSVVWEMNGGASSPISISMPFPSTGNIQGIGDFNGDAVHLHTTLWPSPARRQRMSLLPSPLKSPIPWTLHSVRDGIEVEVGRSCFRRSSPKAPSDRRSRGARECPRSGCRR